MAKVLVTGATGMLGTVLLPVLKLNNFEVITHGFSAAREYSCDLTDSGECHTFLEAISPDIIINLVALTDVDKCEKNPQSSYLLNVKVVENIANWIKDNTCHLVQISTDQVYDGQGPFEEKEINLTNYYGFSKYAGEMAALQIPTTILRTNFFGRSQLKGRDSLSDWLLNSLNSGQSINVYNDIYFSPLLMETLCKMIALVCLNPVIGIFNLGCKNGMSKADFALSIADVFKLDKKMMTSTNSDMDNVRAYRPKDMRMDVAKFEKAYAVDLPTLYDEIALLKEIYNE